MSKVITTDETKGSKRFPGFLVLLFFVEMWERYSYYGMIALLIHFLTQEVGLQDQNALATYSVFTSLGLAGPAIGGLIADKIMGFRNMVLGGGVVITLGHFAMAFGQVNPQAIYFGLGLICVGTSLFKGNITNLLGVCYKDEDPERGRGFTFFYVGINVGSALAALTCSYVAKTLGWHYGFGLAGVGMLVGLLMFIIFASLLEDNGLAPIADLKKTLFGVNPVLVLILGSIGVSFLASMLIKNAQEYKAYMASVQTIALILCVGYIIFTSTTLEQTKKLIALVILIIFYSVFMATEFQLGSLFNLFAERNVDRNLFGTQLPASLSQTINPLSIIFLGLILSYFSSFNKSSVLRNFGLGLFTVTISGFIIYFGCTSANINGLISPIYFILALSFIGLGELLIAPFVYDQTTLLAPKHLKGFVMGVLRLALSCGNTYGGLMVAQYLSVPSTKGIVNPFESLAIYQQGFFNIGVLYIFITLIFIITTIVFLRKIIVKDNK
jgi:POT family proton-dependent oligopeptide transporter